MRGVWGILTKGCAIALMFGGTVRAVDNIRCHDSFFTVVVDETLDKRTSAYVEPIRFTKAKINATTVSPEVIREVSEMWINSAKHGKIAQIYPGYYGESLIDGPKGDIFRTCSEVAIRLSECAAEEARAGNPDGLVDAVRAIEVINIVRYGSHETLFTTNAYLRKPFKILREHLDKLSPELLARLRKAQNPKEREYKAQLLQQISARQRNQYSLRYGPAMTSQDDSTYIAYIGRKGGNIAAEHFFGFDKEIGDTPQKKAK